MVVLIRGLHGPDFSGLGVARHGPHSSSLGPTRNKDKNFGSDMAQLVRKNRI